MNKIILGFPDHNIGVYVIPSKKMEHLLPIKGNFTNCKFFYGTLFDLLSL